MTKPHSILDRRRAGVLLHITSLPSGPGNGDLGPDAYRFVDFLVRGGFTVWQTLPIGPTHADGSPYQSLSAHAGNPLLINLEELVECGWLSPLPPLFNDASAREFRMSRLRQAYIGFKTVADAGQRQAFGEFVSEQNWWLDDYALFTAIRGEQGQKPWQSWPAPLRDRIPEALFAAKARLESFIERVKFEQFLFFTQWKRLRGYAQKRGILLFGDMPIFVSSDSADVWAQREFFDLTEEGYARVVAGVPPDYFSATGQRWGNPHYLWEKMEADGFSWWLDRFRSQLAVYDWVRIDHFRGLEAFWEIPAETETAIHGRWVKAPGEALLDKAFATLDGSGLPLVAENLGIITPEVEALREKFDIPGMLILHFAFDGGPDNPYLPQNHAPNNVVYTGTHDNDTTLSWFEDLSSEQQHHVYECLGGTSQSMPGALIESAYGSVARLAVIPMQDILDLGKGHRMNTPGTIAGNWNWRFTWPQLTNERIVKLDQAARKFERRPENSQPNL